MSLFQIEGYAKIAGVPTDGIECFAIAESRFGGTPPSLGSPVPDASAPDAGPLLSSQSFGSIGKYVLTVPDAASYWVGCYLDTSPWMIAWSGPKMATPHTSKQGWTNAAGIVRGPTLTTTSGGGITLPVATINVVSTTGFAASGQILVKGSSFQLVTYTGTSGTSFTGCSGGSGTILNGAAVIPAYPNLTYRRLLFVTVSCTVTATGQNATATLVSTVSGAITLVGNAGINTWTPTTADQFAATCQLSAPVDPGGVYGLWPQFVGGSVGVNDWVEVDF
jgi:hypothetical protein